MSLSMVGMYMYYQETRYGEINRQRKIEEKKKARKEQIEKYDIFTKNRFGVATNPGESFDKFIEFIVNEYAINRLSEFN